MNHKFQHLIDRYPIEGIEKFIDATVEIFPGQPDSYVEYFINQTFSRQKNTPKIFTVGVVFGMSKHQKNIADTAFSIAEWKKYIDSTILNAKLRAIATVMMRKEKEKNPEFDIENYLTNPAKTESNQNQAI